MMNKLTLEFVLLITLAGSWSQSDQPVRLMRLPYGDCENCIQLIIQEGAGIGLFAVAPDGSRFYLRDGMGVVHVVNRSGQHVARLDVPIPLDCTAVGADGSIVSVGVCQSIELRRMESEPSNSQTTEKSAPDAVVVDDNPSRRIWVMKPDGSIDRERTDGFNRALERFMTEQNRDEGDCFREIAFFTGSRLGLVVMAPVSLSESGEASLQRETGLLILNQDGSWQGLYPCVAASKRGAFLEDIHLRGLEAQQQWVRRAFDPQEYVDYRIIEANGEEYKRDKAPAHPAELKVRLIQAGGSATDEFTLRLEAAGVLLSEPGARLDARGRLYLPGAKVERRLSSVSIAGQSEIEVEGQMIQPRLGMLDGYVVARFTAEGQFDRIVAQLKIPTYHCRPWQLWDIDEQGNLYYLEFTSDGVEIWMVPSQ